MTGQRTNKIPLVSVIIPTYNRVHTLPVSVESVLRQTYHNLEVIVVDDGSTDKTENYVRGLTDSRVRYVRNTGQHGPAAARNLGVRLARGEYVAFQDSDDEWHPDKLEKQMPILLNPKERIDIVYCEYARYFGQKRLDTIPSRDLPMEYKQGDILPVLLLQPLMGTPTIVVKKTCFVQTGGFNESLPTFEDYEFSVRFSRNHRIGFVEEALVKGNDSPDSVDKRFADRIRTQAYIVREMIAPLREYDLLSEKLSEVQKTAEHLGCHDVFLEELRGLEDLFLTEKERETAAWLTEKTLQSDAKLNQRKEMAKEVLAQAKLRLVQTYTGVFRDVPMKEETLEQVLAQVKHSMEECVECFEMPEASHCFFNPADARASGLSTKLERLSLLADVVKAVEELERIIYGQQILCNVCGSRYYKNRSYKCPYCEADDRERLLIAFLEKLQPEEGEILTVLLMISSRLIKNYLLRRRDTQFDQLNPETDDTRTIQGLEEERYDILICPDFSHQTDTTGQMIREWGRIMKTGGVCLIYPYSIWQGSMKWLTASPLCVSEKGKEWFGAMFYSTCGIEDGMVLPILTKGGPLSEL